MATHSSYSCLGNLMSRGTQQATVHEVAKSQSRFGDSATTGGGWGGCWKVVGGSHLLVFKEEELTQMGQAKGYKGVPWTPKDKTLIPAWTWAEAAPSHFLGTASVLASSLCPESQNSRGCLDQGDGIGTAEHEPNETDLT